MITGVITSVLGSLLATKINSELLKKLFGGFLLLIGIFQLISSIIMFFKNKKQKNKDKKYRVVVGFTNIKK